MLAFPSFFFFFFLNDPAPTEIYPLSLPDALPILPFRRRSTRSRSRCFLLHFSKARPTCRNGGRKPRRAREHPPFRHTRGRQRTYAAPFHPSSGRSEEHTSELQSRSDLVCRLLLEK